MHYIGARKNQDEEWPWRKAARDRAAIVTDVNNIFTSGPRCAAPPPPRLSAFCSFAARKNEFFRSVTPVSKSPSNNGAPTTARCIRPGYQELCGVPLAVVPDRPQRPGANERASGRAGLVAETRGAVYMRACISTAQKGSLSSHLWPRRALFPHLTRRFVSRSARPEKIYRHRRTDRRVVSNAEKRSGRRPRAHR